MPKTSPRRTTARRLKVFGTQIGFHNWVVAAPSQQAALTAWDVKENLFALGAAAVVENPAWVAIALESPGVPVAIKTKDGLAKMARIVSLADHRKRTAKPAHAAPRPEPIKRKRAARSGLEAAEKALDDFRKRAIRERAGLIRAQKALDRKADEAEERLASEQQKLEAALKKARAHYDADLRADDSAE